MRSGLSAARLRLLAGTATLALAAAGGSAAAAGSQPVVKSGAVCQAGCIPDSARPAPDPAANEAAAAADILGENGFYLESDELIDDGEADRVIARGAVEARYQGRTLRAREVEYFTKTGVVIARGNAQIINPDGTAQFADEIELDEDLRAGVAAGFSTQLGQGIRIASATAVRRSETVTDLNRAIYTPCPICTEQGEAKSPTFSLQAERVTQDRNRRVIYYRNAVLRVKDVPVFYAPVFFHPDPTADRASGFLVPDIGVSDRRGLSYEQPYYWAISPSQDLTISPQLNQKVNPFLNLEYRKRFYSGELRARTGYTFENDFDSDGEKAGDPDFGDAATRKPEDTTSRSYILADGSFRLDRNWAWGFTAERTSDDLLFRKYDIGDVYQDRGLFLADSQRLISQLYTVRSGPRSYLSVGAISFQGLRPSDDDGTFPLVAPLVEGRFEPDTPIAGGRLRLRGSGVVLVRDEDLADRNRDGVDSRRATVEADWRRTFTLAGGLRLQPLAMVRGDAYSLGDTEGTPFKETVTRGTATVGAEINWPFIRRTGAGSVLLEPVAQVLISPDAQSSDEVPNEDSTVLTFDETNLFRENRYPGFDRYEGGQRVNVGGRATFDWGGGREATFFAGRSFRAERELAFSPTSGLRERSSDYVVAASGTPILPIYFYSRARLDGETGAVRRAEAGVNASFTKVRGGVRYYYDDANPRGVRAHDLDTFGEVLFTKNWGVVFNGTQDLENNVFRRSELGLLYVDECVRLEIVYEREETQNRSLGPSNSVSVRLALATLGATGYRNYDDR